MKTEMNTAVLDTLNDDELRAVIARAQELLKLHDRERKERALAEARTLLSSVGLSLKAVAGKAARHSVPYKGGRHYRHPSKPELVWNAKGQKPNWLRDLEREGGKAVEVTAVQANDNAVAQARKNIA
jgi:DNA-binding protein H-NS